MATVTCHTTGCANAECPIELRLTYLDDSGDVDRVTRIECGVCGKPITDIDYATDSATGPES